MVFVHKPKDDSFWWFKVVAPMPSATLAQANDLFDVSFAERKKEWNDLYKGGKVVEKVNDKTEVCHFQYDPAMMLMSARDVCYVKTRRDLDNGAFLLSYRSVEHEGAPVTKDFVRMELQGANLIQPRPEGGILYTYIQHLDSKVPTLVANKPLGGVMLKETEARRKALSNPDRKSVV